MKLDMNFKERLLLSLSAMWAFEISYSKFGNCSARTSIRKVSAWYETVNFPRWVTWCFSQDKPLKRNFPNELLT